MNGRNKDGKWKLLQELQECKAKERISKFGLERFSSSNEDIQIYTGFPDYVALSEFWKYVEPNSPKLTYFSFVRDKNKNPVSCHHLTQMLHCFASKHAAVT